MSQAASKEELWEQDKAKGKTSEALILALVLTQRLDPDTGTVICPGCGKMESLAAKKFYMYPDGGYKHFSSAGCHGDAYAIMKAGGYSFSDSVKFFAGKPTSVPMERPEGVPEIKVEKFEAVYDWDVLHGVLVYGRKTGGVEAAAEFYSQWHIAPEAVQESQAVMIKDVNHFTNAIVKRFGAERLVACGLFVETQRGPRPILGENFPLVEPHLHPATGYPLYMQFRASEAQHRRYLEHKAGKRPYEGSEKFLSLRGTPRSRQIGMGLPRVASLPAGTTIYIVEGFKDLLAARTMGVEAYAIPGVDFRPDDTVTKLLASLDVVVTLDGDDAGAAHRDRLRDYLVGKGVQARTYELTGGFDIADRLVAKHAAKGCTCRQCQDMLTRMQGQ